MSDIRRRLPAGLCSLLLLIALCFGGGGTALAHTALSDTSPADGEVLEAAPEELRLTFSGKLSEAASLHTIHITGDGQEAVALEELALSENLRELAAALPELANGTYDVSWRVVAADGHTMEGGYRFTVAAPVPEAPAVEEPAEEAPTELTPEIVEPAEPSAPAPVDEHVGHEDHGDHGQAGHDSHESTAHRSSNAFVFGTRILYYFTFLSLLGWALWSAIRALGSEQAAYWRHAGTMLLGLHLAAFILFVAAHWAEMSAGNETASFMETLRYTATGQSWLFTGLLSLAGFPLLFRYRAVDGIWALLMLGAATLRGHSSSFEPLLWSRLADGIHLGAAAVWVGGLLALVLLLRKSREWFRTFAPAFSTAALAAFVVLAVSGVVTAFIYVEQWSDLTRTTWGWLLLAKAALAIVVIPIAALLRRRLRSTNDVSFRRWLGADLALMASVVIITGVLTHVSPVVERVPFHWHVMGETVHLTVEMPDVRAGANAIDVKVWVPEGEGAPEVTVFVSEAKATLRVEEIPLEPWEVFEGFDKYTYTGNVNIADPETAIVRVTIERANGETHEYDKTLTEP